MHAYAHTHPHNVIYHGISYTHDTRFMCFLIDIDTTPLLVLVDVLYVNYFSLH